MTRPLSEMTPEEQQKCVGMFCDNLVTTAEEPAPVVLAGVQGGMCWVLHTDLFGERSRFLLGGVVPRFDLIPAWRPDGTPVTHSIDIARRSQ